MGNAIIARLAPDRRSSWVVESSCPQRQDRVQDRIEEGLSNIKGSREVPMPQHQPWSDFTAAKLLPSSVYLWACDEPQPGGSRPSRSDAWVAWVILTVRLVFQRKAAAKHNTQMMCYIQLIVVSSTKLSDNSSTSSPADEVTSTAKEGSYSLISVAAAMYLMTSIAAADLGAGVALVSEARMDMAAKRWVQRKMFGLMLLASFVLLSAASIRVLFKTSSEDVDLVVGAATVLFIADVDEKVMVVLKAIPSKWRLFWVLEAIGLSVGLALLGLTATGNGGNVSENDYYAEYSLFYSWYFILCIYPVSVTLISLLVNAFVASPKEFVKKHVLGNGSRQDWLYALVLVMWIVTPFLLFDADILQLKVIALIVFVLAIGRACFFVYKRSVCRRGADQSNVGCMSFRWTSSTKFGMICVPVGLLLVRIVLDILTFKVNVVWWESLYLVSDKDWVVILDAFHSALFHMWLVWCMFREGSGCPESPEMPSSPEVANIVVTEPVMIAGSQRQGSAIESHEEGGSRRLTRNVLLGWIQANALIIVYFLLMDYIIFSGNRWLFLPMSATYWFAWTLVGVCAFASSTKGVAFWTLTTYMLYIVFMFVWVWRYDGDSLKVHNFS